MVLPFLQDRALPLSSSFRFRKFNSKEKRCILGRGSTRVWELVARTAHIGFKTLIEVTARTDLMNRRAALTVQPQQHPLGEAHFFEHM